MDYSDKFRKLFEDYEEIIESKDRCIEQCTDEIHRLRKELSKYEQRNQRWERVKDWFFIK